MDVYHKVLVKLFEATGGKETEKIDLKDLVKKEGFLSSYPDIFQQLSSQSWIVETQRPDVVKITHWGIKEAKKSQTGDDDSGQDLKKEITRVITETREFITSMERLANDAERENVAKAEKKLDSINSAFQQLKETIG